MQGELQHRLPAHVIRRLSNDDESTDGRIVDIAIGVFRFGSDCLFAHVFGSAVATCASN